ncbi:MAG: signal peptide peptidase SppA [SAR324 cluster bacterium]|nr:signal peptide peptidase SppA [SAR324 cluster bacterium]
MNPRTPILLLAALLVALLSGCGSPVIPQPRFEEVLLQGEGRDKILMIDIWGPISNAPILIANAGIIPGMTARVRQELEIAFQDPLIRGVLLRINSPGGTITDSDVIYNSLMEFKKSKRVKIVASMGDIAASGALYIAMAADEIYAHPTTVTGSIGVIMPHMDYSELMEELGIKSDPITSGPYKDIDSPYRPRTQEEYEMMKGIVDHLHGKFVDVIVAGRAKMTTEEVRAIADGRLLTAEDAKERGLIDGISYLDEAYRRLSGISGFPENRLVRYTNVWLTGHNIYSNTFPIEFSTP